VKSQKTPWQNVQPYARLLIAPEAQAAFEAEENQPLECEQAAAAKAEKDATHQKCNLKRQHNPAFKIFDTPLTSYKHKDVLKDIVMALELDLLDDWMNTLWQVQLTDKWRRCLVCLHASNIIERLLLRHYDHGAGVNVRAGVPGHGGSGREWEWVCTLRAGAVARVCLQLGLAGEPREAYRASHAWTL
jgi:hypothetical protein